MILIHFAAKNDECKTFQKLGFLLVLLLFRRKYTYPTTLSHGDAIYLTGQLYVNFYDYGKHTYCVDVVKCVLLIKSLKVVLSCVIRLSIMVLQYGRQAGIIWKNAESSNKSKTSLRHAFRVY